MENQEIKNLDTLDNQEQPQPDLERMKMVFEAEQKALNHFRYVFGVEVPKFMRDMADFNVLIDTVKSPDTYFVKMFFRLYQAFWYLMDAIDPETSGYTEKYFKSLPSPGPKHQPNANTRKNKEKMKKFGLMGMLGRPYEPMGFQEDGDKRDQMNEKLKTMFNK